MSVILEYFEILKKAPLYKQQATSDKRQVSNIVREDIIQERSASLANNLIQQAPDKKGSYFKVKKVF